MNNDAVYRYTYHLHSYETGPDGKATVPALCRFMEDIAGQHADKLGAGIHNLIEQGYTWMLSRLAVEVFSKPKIRESVFAETWPVGVERLFAIRDFSLRDEAGEILAAASSSWLIIDLEKRKPIRVTPFISQFILNPERAMSISPEKLDFSLPGETVSRIRVPYSALDLNSHVNNVNYISWALDSYSRELWQTREISRVEINFLSECFAGEELEIRTAWENRDTGHQTLFRGDQEVCLVKTCWRDKT